VQCNTSGAIESVFTVLSVANDVVPPTANLERLDVDNLDDTRTRIHTHVADADVDADADDAGGESNGNGNDNNDIDAVLRRQEAAALSLRALHFPAGT
jgi:hypothetical protein